MKVWINAKLIEQNSCSGPLKGTDDNTQVGFNDFDGSLDDVMIFNRALSQKELVTVMSIPEPACEFQPKGSIIGTAAGDGSSEASPARDCNVLYQTGIEISGMYWIQPDKAAAPFRVYCDMEKDGGGWTLVYKIAGNSEMKSPEDVRTDYLDENDLSAEASGKLSDNMAQLLCSSQFRVEQADRRGKALVGGSDLYCKFDDVWAFADNNPNSKKCATSYSANADYSTAMDDPYWTRGFSTWSNSNGGIITQLHYIPGELPETYSEADGSSTSSTAVQAVKTWFQRRNTQTCSNCATNRVITVDKKRGDTVLRVHWYDNVRCHSSDTSGRSCRWRILINGHECDDPGTIHNTFYNGYHQRHEYPSGGNSFRRVQVNPAARRASSCRVVHYPSARGRATEPSITGNPTWAGPRTNFLLEVDEIPTLDLKYGALKSHDPSWGSVWDSRYVDFNKKREDTALRIEYYDNWRCWNGTLVQI